MTYSSKDYASFRQDILNQASVLLPEWTSHSAGDHGMVLVEAVSYLADILSFYEDRIANEAFIGSAERRESLLALAALLDYNVTGTQPSTTSLQFTASAGTTIPPRTQVGTLPLLGQEQYVYETDERLTLPSGVGATTTLSGIAAHAVGDLLTFSVTSAVSFPASNGFRFTVDTETFYLVSGAGTTTWTARSESDPAVHAIAAAVAATITTTDSITATQGESVLNELVGVGTGGANQIFPLYRTGVLPGTIEVSISPTTATSGTGTLEEVLTDGVRWDYVQHLVDAGGADSAYTLFVDEEDVTYVQFGDSVSGRIVPAGYYVYATYRVGVGVAGNTPANTITELLTSTSGVSAITNPSPAIFGADRESDSSIRINAPKTFFSQNRAVTTSDYTALALRSGLVFLANADASVYTSVSLYAVPLGGSPTVLLAGAASAWVTATNYVVGDYVSFAGDTYRAIENHLSSGTNEPTDATGEWEVCDVVDNVFTYLTDYLSTRKAIGSTITVYDPNWRPINIVAEIQTFQTASREATRQAVVEAIINYLSVVNVTFGQTVSLAGLYTTMLTTPGVQNASISVLSKTSSGAADITLLQSELPVLASLSITPDPDFGV